MRALIGVLAALALGAAGRADAAIFGPPSPPHPRRVVSLAPSLTDYVIALGQVERLVGVTRHDQAPEVAALPRVGGFLDPSQEALLVLRPDLVLTVDSSDATAPLERVASLGVPVVSLRLETIADVVAAARTLGALLGDAARGERLAAQLGAALDTPRCTGAARVRTLLVVGHEPLVVAGAGSFADELLRLAGGENVAHDARRWAHYPLDRAVADDPALVIDAAHLEPAGTIARLAAIPAVRRGDVRRLETADVLHPGPRLVGALAELARALHASCR